VRGLYQIPEGAEYASATLEQRNGDFFIHLTSFQEPAEDVTPEKAVGIDAGVRHQLTLSNGVRIDKAVPFTEKARILHRELSKRKRCGRNWSLTRDRLGKEYDHLANQRKDIRCKVVGKLVSTYDSLAIQEDNIRGWQRMWGKRVATSAIGGIMSDLRRKSHTPVVVRRLRAHHREMQRLRDAQRNPVGRSHLPLWPLWAPHRPGPQRCHQRLEEDTCGAQGINACGHEGRCRTGGILQQYSTRLGKPSE